MGYQLTIKNALGGLDKFSEGIYSSEGEMKFSFVQKIILPSRGKALWVDKELINWKKVIEKESGVRIISMILVKPKIEEGDYGNYTVSSPERNPKVCEGLIEIVMAIPGVYYLPVIKPIMTEAIHKAVKQQFIDDFITNYPTPFDITKQKILGGTLDFLIIQWHKNFAKAVAVKTEEKKDFVNGVKKIIEPYGECKIWNEDQGLLQLKMKVRWENDISDEERIKIVTDIKKLIQEKFNFELKVTFGVL